jgi:hypothetical protein
MSQLQLPGTDTPKPDWKTQPLDWVKANPLPSAIGGLFLFGALSGSGSDFQVQQQHQQQIQGFEGNSRISLKQDEQLERHAQKGFEIAIERQQRCLVLTTDGKDSYANVVEGLVVRDPITGHPLPPNTAVCDKYGWTALLDQHGAMRNLLQGQASPSVQLTIQPAPTPTAQPTPVPVYVPAISPN